MTLVDDDQVEELRVKLLVGLRYVRVELVLVNELLIRGEKHFASRIELAPLDLRDDSVERFEVAGDDLVEQHVSIRQV